MTVRTYSDLLIYVYLICIIDLVFKLQIFAVLPLSHVYKICFQFGAVPLMCFCILYILRL